MALTLTEDLIRNRVNLQHDNLEDVKSLALPGTYHEKVVSLGSSLRKFSRLKQLDLSRNNISSLQGLENLKLLEKLNLYYNNIETLDELKRLKYNPNLKELDLRLNPVTRTEADYRLYLIHMLPSLQKLDDRGVRDRERQGALIHFTSCQATEMTHHPHQEQPKTRQPHPRAQHVKSMGSGKVLDDDDVELLDLIARTGGDLRQPRPITGSSSKDPELADYSLEGLKRLEPVSLDGPQLEMPGCRKKPPAEIDEVMAAYKKRYPNIPDVLVPDEEMPRRRPDQNLEFTDEADAYNKFKSHGFFTPHPNGGDVNESQMSHSYVETERDAYPPPPSRVQLERSRGQADPDEDLDTRRKHQRSQSVPERIQFDDATDDFNTEPRAEKYTPAERTAADRQQAEQDEMPSPPQNTRPAPSETPQSKLFLFQVLDLVDRYWNGTKSLHKNIKFKGMAYTAIEDFVRTMTDDTMKLEIRQLQEELTHARKETSRVRRQEEVAKSSLEDSAATETHLKASLQKAFTDVELLKDRVQSFAQENKRLQQKLQQMDSYGPSQSAAAGSASVTINQTQLDDLQRQNEVLQREIDKQRIQMRQFTQLQELSAMLQESHKSLVKTNGHLLSELDETRQRHQHEVQQLNWSYEQLKRSVEGAPSYQDNTASATLYDS